MKRQKAGAPAWPMISALGALITMWSLPTAGAPAHPPAMTGEQFVRDMRPLPESDLASIRRERAMGYMDGVLDSTIGVRWCPTSPHAAHELSYEAAEQMRRLPPQQLKGSAAALALAVVSRLYPCATKGAKP